MFDNEIVCLGAGITCGDSAEFTPRPKTAGLGNPITSTFTLNGTAHHSDSRLEFKSAQRDAVMVRLERHGRLLFSGREFQFAGDFRRKHRFMVTNQFG